MKKIKEINLSVDTSRYASPHVKGKQPYFSGYAGGMTDSAASSYSSLVNSKKVKVDVEDDEDEGEKERSDLMPENILNIRVRKEKGYSLQETLQVLNEYLNTEERAESLDLLDDMEEVHKGLITDIIDVLQSITGLIPANAPIPGLDQLKAAGQLVGGQVLQFAAGNSISRVSQALAATRSDNRSTVVNATSEVTPMLLALPKIIQVARPGFIGSTNIFTGIMMGVNKIVFDAMEAVGNLGLILERSPTSKDSMYTFTPADVAVEVAGDIIPSAIEAFDPFEVIDGLYALGRLGWNLMQLWLGMKEAEKLIEEYLKVNPGAIEGSTPPPAEIEKEPDASAPRVSSQITQNQSNQLDDFISKALERQLGGLNLPGLNETDYYAIDEDDDDKDREDNEVDEIGGYSLPLGKTNKKPGHESDHVRLYEEIRAIQDWKNRTTGRTK